MPPSWQTGRKRGRKLPEAAAQSLSEAQVAEYLRTHPNFLKNHAELLEILAAPARSLGDGVADFQQFQLQNLQKNTADLKSRYDVLVDFCRGNFSVQSQVLNAVLRLVRARGLEQLLEVLTVDLVALFNVDIVRLAVESHFPPEYYFRADPDYEHSGFGFVPTGTIGALFAKHKNVRLVEDTLGGVIPGFPDIFIDSNDLIRSCAFLRLELGEAGSEAILALGVRDEDRFRDGQGTELLNFMAQIVAHRLDGYLAELAL